MNTRRLSITVIAGALLGLTIAPGLAGAEQGFEAGGSGDQMAHYQMIKQVILPPVNDVVVDFETMKFLEDNLLGYHSPDARFAQLEPAGTIDADAIVDYETMKFLEDNLLGIHNPNARFAQLEPAGTIDADAIVDYETMKFLEDNLLGIHNPNARFAQLDTSGTSEANAAACQGEDS